MSARGPCHGGKRGPLCRTSVGGCMLAAAAHLDGLARRPTHAGRTYRRQRRRCGRTLEGASSPAPGEYALAPSAR